MTAYTTNLCINPSFQLGISGYSSVLGATLTLETSLVLYGTQSLNISSTGSVVGEGVSTAYGVATTASLASFSLFMQGSGTVIVSAVSQTRGVLGSTLVTLTSAWQRAIINQISVTPGEVLYITVASNVKEKLNLFIAGIQIEPESPAHPYVDGDQIGCYWAGGSPGGVSVQPFPNPIVGSANEIEATNVVVLSYPASPSSPFIAAEHEFAPTVSVSSPGPVAAVTDFGIYQYSDPDPAMTYASWNTSGNSSGVTGYYTRNWGVFYPPLDYYASGSQKLWNRAAFMAVGFQFNSVPNNGSVNVSGVQAEVLPITAVYSRPAPSAYNLPRSVMPIVKPDRLNFCVNPSFEVSTAGWTALGTGVLTQDITKSAGNIIIYDDVQLTAGTSSMKVTVNANSDGAQTSLTNLIAGDTYTVSAYVQAGPGLANITLLCANGTTSVLSSGGTGYSFDGYGGGYYGGIPSGTDLTINTWYRISTTFIATDATVALSITANAALDVIYPASIWIDAVLVEAGSNLGTYFDGNFGVDYSWELGGLPGLSRSYYYSQNKVKKQAVNNVLSRHVPMGISSGTPQYNIPYTQ